MFSMYYFFSMKKNIEKRKLNYNGNGGRKLRKNEKKGYQVIVIYVVTVGEISEQNKNINKRIQWMIY